MNAFSSSYMPYLIVGLLYFILSLKLCFSSKERISSLKTFVLVGLSVIHRISTPLFRAGSKDVSRKYLHCNNSRQGVVENILFCALSKALFILRIRASFFGIKTNS